MVNSDVLIPRLETEKLVNLFVEQLPPETFKEKLHILELGVGSGAISLGLARALQKKSLDFNIIATDISAAALAVAKKNIANFHLTDKISLYQADLLHGLENLLINKKWFLIANLPYIPLSRKNQLDIGVIEFEPHQALFAQKKGLSLIFQLLDQIAQITKKNISIEKIYLEIDESHQLTDFSSWTNFTWDLFQDENGKNRYLVGSKLQKEI